MDVFVVLITERQPVYGSETDTMVFADVDVAEKWIDEQIDSYVKSFALDCDSAVDGRKVNLNSDGHTIEYEIQRRILHVPASVVRQEVESGMILRG